MTLRLAALGLAIACAAGAHANPEDEILAATEAYLAMREELSPPVALTRDEVNEALRASDAGSVEIFGDVVGLASSAFYSDDGLSRTLMMALDDGSSVALRAGDSVDRLRVGARIGVIAAVDHEGAANELRVRAWIHEWDLPDEQPVEEPGDDPPPPTPPPDTGQSGQDLPDPAAPGAFRVDAIEVWKSWVREHNPRLSPQQAEDIVRWVLHYSQQFDVNHKLIFALIKWESWFDPACVSHAGAIGLMQLMPGTARSLGVDPRNVQQNIQGGVHYLSEQLAKYADRPNYERVILALACYNAGPNAVSRAGDRVPAITETQRYVRKVSSTFYELHQSGMP